MARIRTIKPEFWSHPVMGRQEDSVKTMAVALLNWADDHGYFYADPAAIRSFARPFDDSSKTTLGCLQQLLKIEYIDVHLHPSRGFIGKVVNFKEHQRVDKPKDSKIKKFFDESPPVIVLGLIQDESKIDPDGKEGKGKDSKGSKEKPSAAPSACGPEVSKSVAQTRHSRIQEMIFSAYREQNSVEPPWDGGEGKQLKELLTATPGWHDGQMAQCLANMYASAGFAKGTRPREFLPRLPKYLHGPLNEFNREKTNGSGTNQSAAAKRDAANVEALIRSGVGAKIQHVHADTGAAVQDRTDDPDRKSKAAFSGN